MTRPRVLILCHASGVWPTELSAVGFDCLTADIKNGRDVRLIEHDSRGFAGIIAEPPCTYFAGSGARWWKSKAERLLLDALAIAEACARAVAIYNPE